MVYIYIKRYSFTVPVHLIVSVSSGAKRRNHPDESMCVGGEGGREEGEHDSFGGGRGRGGTRLFTELRSCVKVEVDVLGSRP